MTPSHDTVTEADQSLPFEINKHYGGISSDFGFSKPSPRYFKKNVIACDVSRGAITVVICTVDECVCNP